MNKKKKIWLTVVLLLSAILTITSLNIFTTVPGLHYLVIVYDSILLLVLAGASYWITRKTDCIDYSAIVLLTTALLTFFFGLSSEIQGTRIGLIICILAILAIIGLLIRLWKKIPTII